MELPKGLQGIASAPWHVHGVRLCGLQSQRVEGWCALLAEGPRGNPGGNVHEALVFCRDAQGSALPKTLFLCKNVGFQLGFSYK